MHNNNNKNNKKENKRAKPNELLKTINSFFSEWISVEKKTVLM